MSFFFNHTATTDIYTLSLHDALPICPTDPRSKAFREGLGTLQSEGIYAAGWEQLGRAVTDFISARVLKVLCVLDRKSTRLNSSHSQISYAVFCLKKKKKKQYNT